MIQTIDFSSLPDSEIAAILQREKLGLTIAEAKKIQTLLNRPPTLTECMLWSIQGSEHCSYKSTRIHLKTLPTQAPQVILGPKEDAGIVAVAKDHAGHRYGIVISHESHNHPSQILPYEGAATGIGGNVRDVCCMGAEVIALADSLRFGDVYHPHTTRIDQGVVQGIAGYGNPIGVPNLTGDVFYDPAYQENCLVTVVTLGIVREDHIIHSYAPSGAVDYELILVGKPTDNSGFGGASFASSNLSEADIEKNKGAVQEPNAFLGRHLLKAHYALFKKLADLQCLHRVGFKDLGAGGIACASVELADSGGYGAEIYLEAVPTSINDLPPHVILCAETQERYMWVVPSALTKLILQHYNDEFQLPQVSRGSKACVIGKIRADKQYRVIYQGNTLVDTKAHDITQGIVYDRPQQKPTRVLTEPFLASSEPLKITLLKLLAHENIAARQSIYECYDKQVQGRTILERGEAAAGVLAPFNSPDYPEEIQQTGIALSVAHNPRYGKIDAYVTAYHAVITSARKVVAVGAHPTAISDCLCFANPEKPEQMHEIVAAIAGIKDACHSFNLPVISGNVSLYNESGQGPIPASPIISCLGVLENIDFVMTPHFKQANSILLRVGAPQAELGGSIYYSLFGKLGAALPAFDATIAAKESEAILTLIRQKILLSVDIIDLGGIAFTLMNMSFKHEIGFTLSESSSLFSESGGFVLEVASKNMPRVKNVLAQYDIYHQAIGHTLQKAELVFNHDTILDLKEAKQIFTTRLRNLRT
ncbi:MAG: phosphoribosylformylglycinamidine synthase subunit PurL [Rickettsiella sp.]|nr:phosphoribosylformylglycinamidine synthase subunit PurL [Rickettsiella sp.]